MPSRRTLLSGLTLALVGAVGVRGGSDDLPVGARMRAHDLARRRMLYGASLAPEAAREIGRVEDAYLRAMAEAERALEARLSGDADRATAYATYERRVETIERTARGRIAEIDPT